MKWFAVTFLSILVSASSFSQSKKLNKLLKKYAFTYANHPPTSFQNSKEIVVPETYSPESSTLYVMKWKNIDSVKIWDTGGNRIRVYLFGKGMEYQLCESDMDTCMATYFSSSYKTERVLKKILFEIECKTETNEQGITKKDRKKLINAFKRLNNTPVIEEYYLDKNYVYPIIEPPRTGIIAYLAGHLGEVYIPAKEIQEVKELKTVLSTYKIVSFVLYATAPGFYDQPSPMFNEGAKFNEDILRVMKRIHPGSTIVFDEIMVENGQGIIQKASTFIINAK